MVFQTIYTLSLKTSVPRVASLSSIDRPLLETITNVSSSNYSLQAFVIELTSALSSVIIMYFCRD